MNIAELFVRIRGDTTDLHRKLTDAERDLLRLERGTGNLDGKLKIAGLSTGRLGNQFANLAGRIAHTSPIIGNLASVLGDFAVGGVVTAGVLGGLAAIAIAYDKLTESTRKAKEETVKAMDAIDKAARLKMLGPGGEMVAQTELARKEADRLRIEIAALEKEAAGPDSGFGRQAMLQEKLNQLYIDRQIALNRVAEGESIVGEAVRNASDQAAPKIKEVTFRYNELRDAAEKVNAQVLQDNRDWWKNYIEKTGEAVTLTEQLNAEIMAARPSLLDVFKGATTTDIGPVDISDSVKIAGDNAKKINDAAAEHTEMLKNAIWGSASQLANSIVSALNFGGGGRGSNIGGSIGGTAGFGLGFAFGGPIGGAIGSTLGNIAGSLFGGLFDHKKAIDTNTAAVRENTAAQLLNSPSGFKLAQYRYDADVGRIARSLRRNASRGGPNPLLVGT